MQNGPIQRILYVKAPKQMEPDRKIYWELTKLPYGIAEASLQLLKVSDEWLNEIYFVIFFTVNQFFLLRDSDGSLNMMTSKNTDYFLISGPSQAIETFFKSMKVRFEVSKALLSNSLHFNGCDMLITVNGTAII